MNNSVQSTKFFLYKLFFIVFFIVWFCLPIGMNSIDLFENINSVDKSASIQLFYGWNYPLSFSQFFYKPVLNILLYSIYLVPAGAIFLIVSIFVKKIPKKVNYLVIYSCLTIMIFSQLSCLILCANTIRWFKQLPIIIYILFTLVAILHFLLSAVGVNYLRGKNPKYAEYKQLYLQSKQELKEKNSKDKSSKIKTKMFFVVIGSIIIILSTFSFIVLNRYKKMMTEALSDAGRTQAEQTATVYDSAEGKYDKISTFFENKKETNDFAEFPYDRIDIIISNSKETIYLENITSSTVLPDFNVFAYTTGRPSLIPAEEKQISSEVAKDYINRYQTGTYRTTPVYDKKNGTCKYVYPVSLTRNQGKKLIGFSVVTYKEEVLMRPFFQTQVSVLVLIVIFLYISIIITLILSDFIVNPLLFLRTSVSKTSKSLSSMMSGSANIQPESLVFEDAVDTNDEIKDLSVDIGNMISLIRGIVPYISVSTLRNADKETKKSSTRELCFLFTDIRGFTTLCEGMQPKEIVSILNHYLDIQTQIILKNGGDIDKFVGDEMMAFFSGPRREINACKAAIEIRSAMYAEQQTSISEGKTVISVGIGINTGKVVFGPVGSSNRMDFTSIGDTVNLAARLEGTNKVYGTKAIISEAVYEKLQDLFVCRELDFITVKGKTQPVKIYELLYPTNKAPQSVIELKNLFEKGLSCYRRKLFDKAEQYFTSCMNVYKDKASAVFLDRIAHFKITPPPTKWDGVFKMDVK